MNDHSIAHFVSGQVLGARALNDVVSYLEGQDRLSRRTLSGIGVVCGFDVDVEGARVDISKGVAVTSEGYLITDEAQSFDRFRPYELPVSDSEDVTEAQLEEERYPFFFDANDTQIPLFELVDTDFVPAPGEENPEGLTSAFLADKTVMLFLECRLESLKSCDVNDCSDRGSELRFTLRRLLLTHQQADAIIAQEAEIANRPVDRATHPMNNLPHLRVEKLRIDATGTNNMGALILRIVGIALKLSAHLPQALRDAYAAYDYIIADLYAPGEDVFPDTYFSNVWGQLAQNIFMVQYFYDYMRDVVMAYNDFVAAAARFEQECLPNPGRFPRHVLLGDATAKPDAFATRFPTPADVLAFDPLTASTGAGLRPRAEARRTHFVPSPAHTHGPRLEELRALFMRMHLLALAYSTVDQATAPIRLTPSKTGDAPLSDRAIPFYYAFEPGSDLHLNWSYGKTRTRLLNTVYSYIFSAPDDAHPLLFRLDDQDFIRIEGIVGKPLGSAMAQLVAWKRELGLSFAIEPVFMPLALGQDDAAGQQLDAVAQRQALEAARQLLLCRLGPIDLIFLVVIRAIFAFLVLLIRRLSDQPTTPGALLAPTDSLTLNPGDTAARGPASSLFETATVARFALDLDPADTDALRLRADSLRSDIIARPFAVAEVLERTADTPADGTAGALFAQVGDPRGGGNLFDRTNRAIRAEGGDEADVRAAYASVSLINQSVGLMNTLSIDSLADFRVDEFSTLYRGFAQAYENYADTVRTTPAAAPDVAESQRRIVASAELVAAQSSAFAASNINTEITAALQQLLSELTLDGYARRHPGLEHSAGVEPGGTFILAYCSIDALLEHAERIGVTVNTPIATLTDTTPPLDNALAQATGARAAATRDPLDRFVVVADFELPYQCCDTDCSDRYIGRRFSASPFGREVDPGPMGVPPFDDDTPTRPGGGGNFGGPGSFTGRFERPVVNSIRTPGGILWRAESPVPTDPDDGSQPLPTPDIPITRERAILRGIVALEPGRNADPIPDTEVILSEAGAATRHIATEDGRFEITVRPGMMAVGAASPDLQGTMTTLHLDPGEEHDIVLVVSRRRG
ncbi:hypothetical protein [Tateyamaria sp. syn59]|uniref:hypothetical protein n=1 Tax=Tateyamaria sp. syn59 TaxID=2576942 RepID=UPI0011BF7E9C|nr:hypothetical protein [Tateyamaria sp. syn59]